MKKKSFEEKQLEEIRGRFEKNQTLDSDDIERLFNQIHTLREITTLQEFLIKYENHTSHRSL